MTSVQATDMRFLGGYVGALFMASSRVLGEDIGAGGSSGNNGKVQRDDHVRGES